jgi:hypothetical protein
MGRTISLAYALAFLATAGGAQAAVTPDQVWAQLQYYARNAGLVLTTGATDRRADRLVLSDISVTRSLPDNGGTTTASLPELTLRDTGDGRVEITGAQTAQLRSAFRSADGVQSELTGSLMQQDALAVVSGTPDDLTIAVTVPAAKVKTDTTRATTPAIADSTLTTLETLAGDLHLKTAAPGRADGSLSAARIGVSGGNITTGQVNVTLIGLAVKTASDLPEIAEGVDFAGLKADGSVTLTTVEVTVETPPPDAGTGIAFTYTLADFATAGNVVVGPIPDKGPSPSITTDGTISIGRIGMRLADPDPAAVLRMTSDAARLRIAVSASIPQGAMSDDLDFGGAIAAGLSVSESFDLASGTSEGAVTSPEFQMNYTAATGASHGEFTLSRTGLLMDISQSDTSIKVETPALPGPADGSMKEFALRLAVPVIPGKQAAPFVLTQRIVDLTLADALWDMADPARAVTRTPLTFVMDISGTARVLRNVFAEGAAATDMPFAPETLDLTDLRLSFGPADIKGTGSFTFDPASDIPKPAGHFNATLKGIYALMNQIGETGLVPPEAFLGLRGGLAVVTKAKGADDLVSDIELKADGTVFANGRRLALPDMTPPTLDTVPEPAPVPPPLAPSPAAP